MIDHAQMKATEVPQAALLAYQKYDGDQHAATRAKDYDALAKMQAWGAFIEAQQLNLKDNDTDDEDGACPLCGEDGGTGCGMPNCQY
jgi:hypothetical protein